MFMIPNIAKNLKLQNIFLIIVRSLGTFQFSGTKQKKDNSLIKQFINEAKLNDAQRPKNHELIINDDFIKKYQEIMSKRPSNGINLFISEKINKNNSNLATEFCRVGKLWSKLNKEEKKSYDNRVKIIQNEIDNNLNSLLSKLSFDEIKYFKEKIKMLNKLRREKLHKFRIKKQQIAQKMPKRPMSAYSLFLKDYLKNEQKSFSQAVFECGEKWRALNQEEKYKYTLEAKRMLDEYREQIKDWENRMIMEGKVQLISSGTRNKIGSNLRKTIKKEHNLKVCKKKKNMNRRKIKGEI